MNVAARVEWTQENIGRMARALPRATIDALREDNAVQLLDFGEPPMLMAVRAESGEHGRELCVVGIEGKGVLAHWPAFEQLCRDNGFARIRGHARADMPAVPRLWRRIGFEPTETVFHREL